MSYISIVFVQTSIMFLLMAIGYICFKIGLVDQSGSKQLSNVAIYVANPALLINAFSTSIDKSMYRNMFVMFILSILVYIISIIVTRVLGSKESNFSKFAMIFSNLGFIGLPLAKNVLGNESVVYMSLFVGVSNLLIWTYGLKLVAGQNKNVSLMKVLLNPCILSIIVGLFLGMSDMKIPSVIQTTVDDLSQLNLPLVMLALGCYLAEGDVRAVLKNKSLYITCFMRLLLIPIILIPIFKILPSSLQIIRMTLLLGTATPVAALMAIFSKTYDGDYSYSSIVVGISTISSLITIPCIMSLAQIIW